jgi:hypothetical protein
MAQMPQDVTDFTHGPASGAVVTLATGERLAVETGLPRLQSLLAGGRCGRVGLKDGAGRWRWVSLADVTRVEPLH